MRKTKTEFKWFTIPQYRQEEEYLTSMHRKGWKFTKVSFPGFYHFEQCEPENDGLKIKYLGVFAGLVLCTLFMGATAYFSFSSNYSIHDNENGFIVEAQRLNKSIVKEYDLEKGDIIQVSHKGEAGQLYISIKQENEEPVFYGNTFDDFDDFSVEIQEDGCYQIKCSGKKAKGTITFTRK